MRCRGGQTTFVKCNMTGHKHEGCLGNCLHFANTQKIINFTVSKLRSLIVLLLDINIMKNRDVRKHRGAAGRATHDVIITESVRCQDDVTTFVARCLYVDHGRQLTFDITKSRMADYFPKSYLVNNNKSRDAVAKAVMAAFESQGFSGYAVPAKFVSFLRVNPTRGLVKQRKRSTQYFMKSPICS